MSISKQDFEKLNAALVTHTPSELDKIDLMLNFLTDQVYIKQMLMMSKGCTKEEIEEAIKPITDFAHKLIEERRKIES